MRKFLFYVRSTKSKGHGQELQHSYMEKYECAIETEAAGKKLSQIKNINMIGKYVGYLNFLK